MTIHPMPPIPPRPPGLPSVNASSSERSVYLSQRTRYRAQMLVYERQVEKYKRDMKGFIDDPDAGTPLELSSEDVQELTAAAENQQPAGIVPLITSDEPEVEPVTFEFQGNTFIRPANLNELNLAVALATAAVAMQVEAGDLFWHGGDDPFSWKEQNGNRIEMDAETLIEFAKAAHNAS